jgi:hypothetical protein
MATALPESVVQAREAATQAQATAGQLGAMEPSISDVLRQKITEAYANNQDIVGPLDVATTEYLGAPMAAREKYQNIFNPFQRENLVQQYQGNKALPMLMYSNMMGNRLNTAEDIIGAGTRGFQSQVAAAQAKATQAQQNYTNLLNEYQLTKPETKQLDVGNEILFLDEEGNIIQRFKKGAAPSTAAPKSALEKLMELKLAELYGLDTGNNGDGGGGVNISTKPQPPDLYEFINKDFDSYDGQWHWVASKKDWFPIFD